MREIQRVQMQLGEVDPEFVSIDPRNRDKLSQTLLGLQTLYADRDLRRALLAELEAMKPECVEGKDGRPGMSMWEIFVLAIVRLGCDWDFDTLKNQAESHLQLRQFLGVSLFEEDCSYPLQTIRDCVAILTEESLMRLNTLIVHGGQRILGVDDASLEVRGDSFVVLSNVHYPTDINLLLDAMRKSITLVARLADEVGLTGWRKWNYNLEQLRILFLKTLRMKHSTSQNPEVKEKKAEAVKECHRLYIDSCSAMLARVGSTLDVLDSTPSLPIPVLAQIPVIRNFVDHGNKQIDLIRRRVLEGETIPHHEKIFSIFEEYTEWLSKGKAGVKQELGLNVCVLSDQYGFILHHRVMQDERDVDVAVDMVEEALKNHQIASISFDKGFHSPANQEKLSKLVSQVVLPKKGKPNSQRREEESAPEFVRLRRAHSAVESTINALGSTGLDRCPDRGITAFRRYVAIGIVARNLKTLGNAIRRQLLEEEAA